MQVGWGEDVDRSGVDRANSGLQRVRSESSPVESKDTKGQ